MFSNKRHIQGALQRLRKRWFTIHETGIKNESDLCCAAVCHGNGACIMLPLSGLVMLPSLSSYSISASHVLCNHKPSSFRLNRSGFNSFKGCVYAAVMHDYVFDEKKRPIKILSSPLADA